MPYDNIKRWLFGLDGSLCGTVLRQDCMDDRALSVEPLVLWAGGFFPAVYDAPYRAWAGERVPQEYWAVCAQGAVGGFDGECVPLSIYYYRESRLGCQVAFPIPIYSHPSRRRWLYLRKKSPSMGKGIIEPTAQMNVLRKTIICNFCIETKLIINYCSRFCDSAFTV